jgi:hypothetical protein
LHLDFHCDRLDLYLGFIVDAQAARKRLAELYGAKGRREGQKFGYVREVPQSFWMAGKWGYTLK